MKPQLVEVYKALKRVHEEVFSQRAAIHEAMRTETDMKELADIAYATREAVKFVEEIRKDLNKINDVAQKLGTLAWTKLSPDGEPIRTDYCIGTPKVHQGASLPTKDKDFESYEKLMNYIGIPYELYGGEYEVVRPHWPGFIEWLSDRAEQGEPLPPGVDPERKYPIFKLSCRKVKEVDA